MLKTGAHLLRCGASWFCNSDITGNRIDVGCHEGGFAYGADFLRNTEG